MFADIHLLELHNIDWIHMKINSANPTKKCKPIDAHLCVI